ncbi:hypothetical protein AYX14_05898 [Cryptococcus neoformans]|nr:hypothetical protein AYX14_05898 [Cryptococcus neoformans var. grubii]
MSLVDSLDSILMLYAYATPDSTSPEGKLALLQYPDPNYKDSYLEETLYLLIDWTILPLDRRQGKEEAHGGTS